MIRMFSNGSFQCSNFIENGVASTPYMRMYSNSNVEIVSIAEAGGNEQIKLHSSNNVLVCAQIIEVA
jgi:hypothetical protein